MPGTAMMMRMATMMRMRQMRIIFCISSIAFLSILFLASFFRANPTGKNVFAGENFQIPNSKNVAQRKSNQQRISTLACQEVSEGEEKGLFPPSSSTNNDGYILAAIGDCGGLGNQMYRFASLYGIAKPLNRRPSIFQEHFEFCENEISSWNKPGELERIFPVYWRNLYKIKANEIEQNETANIIDFGNGCCQYENPAKHKLSEFDEKYIVLGRQRANYLQNYKYFHAYRGDIRKIFAFSREICKNAQTYSEKFFGPIDDHKLCVHTRRGDFQNYGFESKKKFTKKATNFVGKELKPKYGNISIVLLGEDKQFLEELEFEEKLFSRILVPDAMGRGEDMAFAVQNCDSLLITAPASTYSFWIGYLMAPNAPVYYNADFKTFEGKFWATRENMLPEWTALNAMYGKIEKI